MTAATGPGTWGTAACGAASRCSGYARPPPAGWRACRHAGLEVRTDLPHGVEAVRRGDYLFLISHTDRAVELDLGAKRLDLLTGAMVGPAAVLAPRDALVLTPDASSGPGR
jgi:hypothetical protein